MSLRGEITAWWRNELASGEPFDRHERAQAALAAFQAMNPTFAQEFVAEFGEKIMLEVGQDLMAYRRRAIRAHASLATVDQAITREAVIAELNIPTPSWSKWIERDPVSGQDVPLFQMTKAQLCAASAKRSARVGEDLHRIALLSRLADGMADGETVGERYSPDDITRLDAELSIDMAASTPWDAFLKGPAVRV